VVVRLGPLEACEGGIVGFLFDRVNETSCDSGINENIIGISGICQERYLDAWVYSAWVCWRTGDSVKYFGVVYVPLILEVWRLTVSKSFAGAPFKMLAGENKWNTECEGGQISKVLKELDDLVRAQ